MDDDKLSKYTNKLAIVIEQTTFQSGKDTMRQYLYRYVDYPRPLLTELFIALALANSYSYERPGTCCP
jgi:hypothetical protein